MSSGRALAALGAVAVLSFLPGITRCNVLCKDVDEQGNPITYSCVQCQVSAFEKAECKADIWLLEEGAACDQASQQPNLPDGEACDFAGTADGTCSTGVCEGPLFACTEQGVLDAIAAGGGTIDCAGPTTINTTAEIVIASDAVLDGRGNLTLDAGYGHRVVRVLPGVTAELRRMTLTRGKAAGSAGDGVYNEGDLTLRNTSVVSNGDYDFTTGTGEGYVAVWSITDVDPSVVSPPSLRVIDSVVSSNRGATLNGVGSGVFAAGTVEIVRSTIADNEVGPAVTIGTALLPNTSYYPSTAIIEDSTISSTHADAQAALSLLGPLDVATITRSTASGVPNGAQTGSQGGTLLIQDSVFAGDLGVGLLIHTSLDATVQNTTITGGSRAVAVVGPPGGSTLLSNVTMLATDAALGASATANVTLRGSALFPGCATSIAAVSSSGYNIEAGGDTCGFTDPTDQVDVTPAELNLGPLQDNGGPTHTFLPGPGSVAIDAIPAADCVSSIGLRLTADQRGVGRPQGTHCDVGAVEVEQP